MTNLLDYRTLPEEAFLEELIDDLEGTLSVIAYTDHCEDLEFIQERQKYFETKYKPFLHLPLESNLFLFRVLPAYEELESLLKGNPSSKTIISRCEEGLSYLVLNEEQSEEFSEDEMGDFAEFFENYAGR